MQLRPSRPLTLSLVVLLAATSLLAANAHKCNVDDNDTVVIHGNVHPSATPRNDRGPADASLELEKMILLLEPRAGKTSATLATYSNLNKNTGYGQQSFNLNAYIGQTIQVFLVGVEDTSAQTTFVVDDFALNVQ